MSHASVSTIWSPEKTGDFGSQFKLIAHLDPAGREGSAPGCRGLLGLLPNNGGIEGREDSSPQHSPTAAVVKSQARDPQR